MIAQLPWHLKAKKCWSRFRSDMITQGFSGSELPSLDQYKGFCAKIFFELYMDYILFPTSVSELETGMKSYRRLLSEDESYSKGGVPSWPINNVHSEQAGMWANKHYATQITPWEYRKPNTDITKRADDVVNGLQRSLDRVAENHATERSDEQNPMINDLIVINILNEYAGRTNRNLSELSNDELRTIYSSYESAITKIFKAFETLMGKPLPDGMFYKDFMRAFDHIFDVATKWQYENSKVHTSELNDEDAYLHGIINILNNIPKDKKIINSDGVFTNCHHIIRDFQQRCRSEIKRLGV